MPRFQVGDYIEFEPSDGLGTWTGEIVEYSRERIGQFSTYDCSSTSYLVKVTQVVDGYDAQGWVGNESGERFWWVDHGNRSIRVVNKPQAQLHHFYLVSPVFAGGE